MTMLSVFACVCVCVCASAKLQLMAIITMIYEVVKSYSCTQRWRTSS